VLSPPHFPVTPDDLIGKWTFNGLEPGEHDIEGFQLVAREIPHTGGRTFGYRVTDGRASLAYLSDHAPISLGQGPRGHGEFHEAALELARGVDVLIHDAQYTANEFASRAHYGHSTIDYAIELGERAGVGKVILFHHDPSRTDEQLDAVVDVNQHHVVRVVAATEGMALDLRGR
jgi:ribonuclease BN (tRNA processing enzyme)